ncbi:MAG TPA: hypothetical protein VL404_07190 [Candidatus Eisenbacteria bacterium]|jgi:hypothetical protein|nr:hypothetical protein [Candidatus Eisenbacteria bacterium]
MKKSLLFLAVCLLVFPASVRADQYWNGHDCVDCPFEGPGSGLTKEPIASTGQNGTGPLTELSPTLIETAFDSTGTPAESYIAEQPNGSFLYFIEGRVKSVEPRSNLLIVKNLRTHRNQAVYVVDPLMSELRERNLVEIWLKPGSDRAERIRRLS